MTPPEMPPLPPDFGRIGLGCVTFGREIDEAAAFALMDHAYSRGVRGFDTAAAYGGGASERLVGRWLAARRPAGGSLIVATKLLPPYTPEALRAGVEASRQRLGVDTLDVLYLHRWDATAEADAVLVALDRLVNEGRVRHLGFSNVTAAPLERLLERQAALGLAPFRAVQNNHNLAVCDLDESLRTIARRLGLALVGYSPLAAGFLTGKHRYGAAPDTRFTLVPGHQDVYFHPTAFRRLDHLLAVAARTGHPAIRLALAWALHQPDIGTVLVGGRTPAHLDQAFEALAFNDPAVLAELAMLGGNSGS